MSSGTRIAVFISGGGSNLQSLIDASLTGELSGEIVLVISNNDNAYGLERAQKAGIDTFVYKVKNYSSKDDAHRDLLEMIDSYKVEYIALAGFLKLLPAPLIQKYRNKITNIHPALLPKYGGKGMYGHHVHEAVLTAGDSESGATVHLVDEVYDHGKVLLQKKVPVKPDDTPDTLAARVLKVEHQIYPEALDKLIKGKISNE
jgi:phosphoribosylglycinamide formyltransferase-1